VVDTVRGFAASRKFTSYGPSLTTNIYGIFNFKKGKIKALRHVVRPRVSYNFLPDFSTPFWNNFQTINYTTPFGNDTTITKIRFIDESITSRRQSNLSFSLNNTFDMKVRTPKDSLNKEKKIELLRSLDFSSGYDFARDSFKMNNIRMSANADFLNKFTVNFDANFSPYTFDIAKEQQLKFGN